MLATRSRVVSLLVTATLLVSLVLTGSSDANSTWSINIAAARSTNYKDKLGTTWLSDRYFEGGSTWGNTRQAIAGTRSDPLYQRHRWGMSGYAIPVPSAGVYRVSLHLAEIVFRDGGKRVFDVAAEGSTRLQQVDVINRVGYAKAAVERFDVQVVDGVLDLDFLRRIEDPMISGIAVERISGTVSSDDGPNFENRVNVGSSSQYTDSAGKTWVSDVGYTNGSTFGPSPVAVAGTNDDPLYQKHRWGMNGLSIRVPQNGSYTVRLHFAEIVFGERGKRVFDVAAENTLVLNDLDVFAKVGHANALVEQFTVPVYDDYLTIAFGAVVEDPMLSGIEIVGGDGTIVVPAPESTSTSTTAAPTTTTTAAPTTTTTAAPTTTTTTGSTAPTMTGVCTGRDANGGVPADKWPGPDCTGVKPGTILRDCPRDITASNQTFENCHFKNGVYVHPGVGNLTFKNSLISGSVTTDFAPRGYTFIDVEVAVWSPGVSAFTPSSGTNCLRCRVHHTMTGFYGDNLTIVDSYLHDLYGTGQTEPCTHMAGAAIYGGNVVMRHNTMMATRSPDGGGCTSAAIAIYSHGDCAGWCWGDVDNVVIENNYLESDGVYCLYGGDSNEQDPSNIRIAGNTFAVMKYNDGTACNAVTSWLPDPTNVWLNNKDQYGNVIREPGT